MDLEAREREARDRVYVSSQSRNRELGVRRCFFFLSFLLRGSGVFTLERRRDRQGRRGGPSKMNTIGSVCICSDRGRPLRGFHPVCSRGFDE